MTAPDTDTLAGLRDELRLIGCHQNGDARCTCAIGADAVDAIDALRAQAAKDKARIERLEAALRLLALRSESLVHAHQHGNGLEGWHNTVDGVDRAITAARAALEDGE